MGEAGGIQKKQSKRTMISKVEVAILTTLIAAFIYLILHTVGVF